MVMIVLIMMIIIKFINIFLSITTYGICIYIILSSYVVLLLNLSTHHLNILYISIIFITPPIISIYNSIQDNNTTIQHEGLLQMRKVLSSDYPHIELFANSGIIVLLSNLLLSTNENICMETAWCLTNIATGIH